MRSKGGKDSGEFTGKSGEGTKELAFSLHKGDGSLWLPFFVGSTLRDHRAHTVVESKTWAARAVAESLSVTAVFQQLTVGLFSLA